MQSTILSRCLLPLASFSFFEVQEVRVVFRDEAGIGKAKVAILSYYDVVEDLNLHNISGED